MENENKKIEELVKNSEKHAEANGFKLNPDQKVVERVVNGLLKNKEKYGKIYCPCRRITGNRTDDKKITCPCIYHKDEIAKDGKCFCGLFVR